MTEEQKAQEQQSNLEIRSGLKQLLGFLPFLNEIEVNPEMKSWCISYNAYKPVGDFKDILKTTSKLMIVFYECNLNFVNYLVEIESYGLVENDLMILPDEILGNADLHFIRVLLTWHFRRDYYCEGSLINMSIAEGKILKLILKIRELLNAEINQVFTK